MLGLVLLSLAAHADGPVTFHTDPSGARVYLEVSGLRGGNYLGLSGAPLRLDWRRMRDSGSFDVRFEVDGYRSETRNIKSLYFYSHDRYPESGQVRLEPLTMRVAIAHYARLHRLRLSLLALGAGLLGYLLAQRGRRRRLTERQLETTLRELQQQEQELRRLSRVLVEARDQGRQDMAHDLHDGLLQYVVAAGLHLETHSEEFGGEMPGPLGRALVGLRSALDEGRRLVRQLGPAPLEAGLEPALLGLCKGMSEHGFQVENRIDLRTPVSPAVQVAAFRLVQEAFNNVQKHAGPCRVELQVTRRWEGLAIQVRDAGKGFDLDAPRRGVGLDSMRSRALGLGGRCQVESTPGQGTVVEAWLPERSSTRE